MVAGPRQGLRRASVRVQAPKDAEPGRTAVPCSERLHGEGEGLPVGRRTGERAGSHSAATARTLEMRPLKDLVLTRFPEDHPLREVILAEKDLLTPSEFVVKMEIWAVLLNRKA